MTHKIEGYVRSNQDRFFGPKGNSSPIVMHEEAELGRKHHQATIVLHEGKAERVFTESEVRAMLAVIDVGLQNALHNFDCDLTPLQQSGEEYVDAAIAEDAKCTCGLDQAAAVVESLRDTPLLTNGA